MRVIVAVATTGHHAADAGPGTAPPVVFWAGFAIIVLGAVGGMFPLWRSSTLSPDSIQRRVFWSGCAAGVGVLFASQLPDLATAAFLSVGTTLAVVAIAFNWTNHIKISGRTYAAFANLRQPDRPPALRRTDAQD